jgi:hypothetical protein
MFNTMRRATFMASVGLLAVACSGAPAGTAVPTLPGGATIPPIDVPSNLPSISLIPDQPLEDLFPDDIGGNTLNIESAQGASVAGLMGNDPAEFNQLLTDLGTTADQVSAAFSFNLWPGATATDFTGITITALRVRNVPAATTLQNLLGLVTPDVAEDAEIAQTTVSGKPVTSITDPDDEEGDNTVYLYAVGDTVFLVGGTPVHVEEAFAELP